MNGMWQLWLSRLYCLWAYFHCKPWSVLLDTSTAPHIDHTPNFVDRVNEGPKPGIRGSLGIHILAYNRLRSLERLLNSLAHSDVPLSSPFNLYIHIDVPTGSTSKVHSRVLALSEGFKWAFGNKTVLVRERHFGLVNVMRTLTHGDSQRNEPLMMVLEDDVELSPHWPYMLQVCRQQAVATAGDLFGCALHTPRVNEVIETEDDTQPPLWNFGMFTKEPWVLYQLPCSWGSIVRRDKWLNFLDYLTIRIGPVYIGDDVDSVYAEREVETRVLDGLRSFKWKRSWKKFLIDHYVLNNEWMLYVNLPKQHSFATNHYEEGLHTVGDHHPITISQLIDTVDVLRADKEWVDIRFTVPLIADPCMLPQVPRNRTDLPHFDALGQVVMSL